MNVLSSTQETPNNQFTLLHRVLVFSQLRISPDVDGTVQRGIAIIDWVPVNEIAKKMVASIKEDLDSLERISVIESMEDLMLQNRSSATVALFEIDEKLILVDEVCEGLHRTCIGMYDAKLWDRSHWIDLPSFYKQPGELQMFFFSQTNHCEM